MAKQRKIWIGLCLLATVLSGTTRIQASLAEEATQSAGHHSGSHSFSAPGYHPMSGDRGTHGSVTDNPGGRNAIGARIAPQSVIQKNVTPLGLHTLPPIPSAAASEMSNQVPTKGTFGGPGMIRLNSSPTGVPPIRNAIGGAALIRPGVAPHGIGGPANGLTGINGTTLVRKH